jgi:hypothetical protein
MIQSLPFESHLSSLLPDQLMVPDNSVFTFGSNESGRHGAGAALLASQKYGAKYLQGRGLQGKSYAIPTKNRERCLRGVTANLPLNVVQLYVTDFLEFAKVNPNKNFFVTRVGCGLAGHLDKEMAPMFKGATENVYFSPQWSAYGYQPWTKLIVKDTMENGEPVHTNSA